MLSSLLLNRVRMYHLKILDHYIRFTKKLICRNLGKNLLSIILRGHIYCLPLSALNRIVQPKGATKILNNIKDCNHCIMLFTDVLFTYSVVILPLIRFLTPFGLPTVLYFIFLMAHLL